MKKNLFALALTLWSAAAFSQEVISDLKFNPALYHKYKSHPAHRGSRQNADKYVFAPDTLSLPFFDDFSMFHLKSYEPASNYPVAFRVIRSVSLADTVFEFSFMTDTTWTYAYNSSLQTTDTIPNAMVELTLYNDLLNPETVRGWPAYNIFDTTANPSDTIFLTPDSILQYSFFNAVRDSDALWLDNYVYLNDNYPVKKLSYGVATFDGLNQYGLPFNDSSLNAYGYADTLTSQPINLQGLDGQNVYLSFAYEPQGLGNKPEPEDSLILEFRLIGKVWEQVWAVPGSDSTITDPVFKRVLIPLTNPFYFSEAFQFRFRNKATLTGNNDLWHLDYVYLDKNRSAADTVVKDMTVLNPASSFLKNYRSMPWNHFAGFEAAETQPTVFLSFRNNNSTAQNLGEIAFLAKEVFTDDIIYRYPPGLATTIGPFSELTFDRPSAPFDPFLVSNFIPYPAASTDSVLIDVITSFSAGAAIELTPENNNVSSPVLFKNYFAYDDGSAEKAYGLQQQGSGLLKFAYEFRLNHSDTLRAIEIHFSQVNENLSLFEFTLMVWKSIDTNNTGAGEDTLYYQPRTRFQYIPQRNGFAIYLLEPPLALDVSQLNGNKFYIGWQQLFPENMQVGLDLNSSAKEHMYFYADGEWSSSQVDGAVMIRPVVGKPLPVSIGNETVPEDEIVLFPNPAEEVLYIRIPHFQLSRADIYDMQGRLVKSIIHFQEPSLDISALRNGLYCLRITGKNKSWVQKFVKQ